MRSDPFADEAVNSPRSKRAIEEFQKLVPLSVETLRRTSCRLRTQMVAGAVSRMLHVHMVADEIKALDGSGRHGMTIDATRFERSPLRGLWHKHFFQPAYMEKNIELHWKERDRDRRSESRSIDEIVRKRLAGQDASESAVAACAYEVIVGGYEQRAQAKSVTGEWLVFQKHEGVKYYLMLATHGAEGCGKARDAILAATITSICKRDFPFLLGTFD